MTSAGMTAGGVARLTRRGDGDARTHGSDRGSLGQERSESAVASTREFVIAAKTGLSSDDVLKELSPGLLDLGYVVESGKTKAAKISRPVLFGENGVAEVSYEIDGFHDELGVAVEVEAGRGASNNADYRDLVRTSLILHADFLAMLMPITYRTTTPIHAYARARHQLDAIYASSRLTLPFCGVLLVGC
jgi:hypothetical protein